MEFQSKQIPMWVDGEPDPYLDLYPPERVIEIAKTIKMVSEKSIVSLGVDLGNLAQLFLEHRFSTNLDMRLGERAAWVKTNLVNPAQLLLDALNYRHEAIYREEISMLEAIDDLPHRQRTSWGIDREEKLQANKDSNHEQNYEGLHSRLRSDLALLTKWAQEKSMRLGGNAGSRKKIKTIYKEELVFQLLWIYKKYVTKKEPTRKTDAPDERQPTPRTINSEFTEFVRRAAEPILGEPDKLDDQVKLAIAKYKRMKKSGRPQTPFFS